MSEGMRILPNFYRRDAEHEVRSVLPWSPRKGNGLKRNETCPCVTIGLKQRTVQTPDAMGSPEAARSRREKRGLSVIAVGGWERMVLFWFILPTFIITDMYKLVKTGIY